MATYKLNKEIISNIADGEMKKITVSDTEVIIVKRNGQYHALSGTCPHKGAPLEEGLLSKTGILCPWHHARFDESTGNLLDGPARDGLQRFPLTVKRDIVELEVPDDSDTGRCSCQSGYNSSRDSRTFVVLGAGAAGAAAVETLRNEGFQGRILMITRENRLPYDRTDLSKGILAGKSDLHTLRSREFYDQCDIEVRTNTTVEKLDPDIQKLTLTDGSSIHYNKLLLATGSTPVTPGIDGTDLSTVFTVRTPNDIEKIVEKACNASHAMFAGAGFISLECAAQLRHQGLAVTIATDAPQPMYRILGHAVGGVIKKIHQNAGVQFYTGARVASVTMENNITSMHMENGQVIKGDFVILGTGVQPATDYIHKDLKDDDGGISVDAYLQVPNYEKSLFSAGDMARFPAPDPMDGSIRVEHWRVAEQMGRTAALNMLDQQQPFDRIPFFWTRQHGKGLKYLGHIDQWDDIRITGNLNEQEFAAFYLKNAEIKAVAAMGMGDLMEHMELCMVQNNIPSIDDIEAGTVNWEIHSG